MGIKKKRNLGIKAGLDYTLYVKRYEDESLSLRWFSEYLSVAKNVDTGEGVLPLIAGVKGLFKVDRFDVVDELLKYLDFNLLNEYSIAAFFRSSYPAKSRLRNWRVGVNRAERELNKRGVPVSEVLRGL